MTPSQMTKVSAENERLRQALEDARREAAALRREVEAETDHEAVLELMRALGGLNFGEACLLSTLYRADGKAVDAHKLLAALPPIDHARERDIKQVGVRVYWIRRKLGRELIGSSVHYKNGYWITEEGKARIDNALIRHRHKRLSRAS